MDSSGLAVATDMACLVTLTVVCCSENTIFGFVGEEKNTPAVSFFNFVAPRTGFFLLD